MNEKEKAEQLINQFRSLLMNDGEDYGEEIIVSTLSKQCALICVDEIIQVLLDTLDGITSIHIIHWWEGVKENIEKL